MSRGLQTQPGLKKKKKRRQEGMHMKNKRRHVKFANLQYDENCACGFVKLVPSSSLELLL